MSREKTIGGNSVKLLLRGGSLQGNWDFSQVGGTCPVPSQFCPLEYVEADLPFFLPLSFSEYYFWLIHLPLANRPLKM